jgi:diguanylate cyclase (GGDEF)-like protein
VKAKVLLVEDSDGQGDHIMSSLEKRGYQVTWAKSGIEALRLARTEGPDIVILDVVLGDVDGFSVCRWLKMHEVTRDVPIIMLTVKDELQYRVEGLNVGANDYLPKPFADEELEARIFAALRVRAQQAELRQRNSQLESMLHSVETLAITDALTGLFNRRRFTDVLLREHALVKRYGNSLCCLMVDIDHFKAINDRIGHLAGDRVLQEVAQRLAESLREVDLAARYGGEEFVILLPHTTLENGCIVANRIADLVRGIDLELEGTRVKVTASFGIASTESTTIKQADDLVKAADQALYRAKRNGRDRIETYDPQLDRTPTE